MLTLQDRRLLREYQHTPEAPTAALAERLGLTARTFTRRVEALRAAGVIKGVQAQIDWKAFGYTIEVSLRVTLDKTQSSAFDDFLKAARGVPEVTEIQTFLGRVDVRLTIVARDLPHYQMLYRERILTLPHIADIEALMQVAPVLTRDALPL